jgi:hypothetical protein
VKNTLPVALVSMISLAFAGAMLDCGSSNSSSTFHGGGLADGSLSDGNDLGDGGSESGQLITGDGSQPTGALTITPLTPSVTVTTGQPLPTVQFKAEIGGVSTNAGWGLDRGELGTINGAGLFTPSGTTAGVGNITASVGTQKATTTITVNIVTTQMGDPGWTSTPGDAGAGGYGGVGGNGPGAPPTGTQVTTLNGTPTADSTVSIMYPYDKTVWPLGLLAPLLQWNPGAHTFDSVYVHIKEANYEYKGYFGANAMPFMNVPIPQQAWSTMGFSNGGTPVTITLIFGQGTTAYGPYTETWTIAPALLQGTIYYNSYGTSLVKNSDTDDHYGNQYGAGTLAILPGATAPTLIAGVNSPMAGGDGTGCRVCHTVSGAGNVLVTQASNASASSYADTMLINLGNDTTMGAGMQIGTELAFPALYKDGSLLFSSSGGMRDGDTQSQLYALPGGALVPGVMGLNAGFQASLPAFSPDGKHTSFNFYGGTMTAGTTTLNADQKSLGILDFNGTNAFSNPRVLYTPMTGDVAYSSFFPTSSAVAFELELSNGSGFGFTWDNNTGELWWADVASGKPYRLDQLNGYDAMGNVYLPAMPGANPTHTPTQDATVNYEPTVNPVASGGYAWVVFTSRRLYGTVTQLQPWLSDPRSYPWLDEVTDKKLWVAAVDLNGTPGTDPSHPAFYLPGQELYAGNARGYWTVEACRANGMSCQEGDQCCGGYCQPSGDGGLVCSSSTPTCAGQYEKCTVTADCCGAAQGIQCIGGLCTQAAPQ